MKVERRLLSDLDARAVRALTGDCFFASPGFSEVWKAKEGRPVVWTVQADGALAAVLPGLEIGHGPLASFLAMPDGCYSGLFTAPALTAERGRFGTAVLDAVSRHRYARRFVFDFYGTLPRHPGFEVRPCETTLVTISGPEWVPPDEKLRSQIRKAEREGITMEPFEWDRHQEQFLRLMEATELRHGNPPRYPPEFFRALADLAHRDDRVHWVWCEHEGRPACSHIYFIEGGMLQGWQIYFDKAFSFLKPNQYIRFAMCRRMAARGIASLNLGGTPENAPGLADYKRRWGGRSHTFPAFAKMSGVGKLIWTGPV
jgi:hypothetical protein